MLEDKTPQRTPISSLGEFGLIDHLSQRISLQRQETVCGIGDDAAVLNPGNARVVSTTDLLVEGVHFDLSYVPLMHLGYKSAVVNFSDIYAMNAQPVQMLVGLAVSNRFPVEAIDEIYEGMRLACKHYKVDLVGGDTTSSTSGLMLSITALGLAAEEELT